MRFKSVTDLTSQTFSQLSVGCSVLTYQHMSSIYGGASPCGALNVKRQSLYLTLQHGK